MLKLYLCFKGDVAKADSAKAVSIKMDEKKDFVFNVFVFKWGKFNTFGGS